MGGPFARVSQVRWSHVERRQLEGEDLGLAGSSQAGDGGDREVWEFRTVAGVELL